LQCFLNNWYYQTVGYSEYLNKNFFTRESWNGSINVTEYCWARHYWFCYRHAFGKRSWRENIAI